MSLNEVVPGFKATEFIKGPAMGKTEAELKSLYDIAEEERKRQQIEKNNIEKKHKERIQFVESFIDKARKILSSGQSEVIDLSDGTFLKILKGNGFVSFAITSDQYTNVHNGQYVDAEKVSLLVNYSIGTNEDERIAIWDQEALQKICNGDGRYKSVTKEVKNLEVDDPFKESSVQELEQLVAFLPFKLQDLDKAIKES